MAETGPANGQTNFARCRWRYALVAFGWLNVAVGAVGLVVPGLPTTVFMLIALWAFSKSSERFHCWLYNHPRFGATLRAWHRDRAIPRKAKLLAVGSMAVSLATVTLFVAESWELPVAVGASMAAVCAYILTRPTTTCEGA